MSKSEAGRPGEGKPAAEIVVTPTLPKVTREHKPCVRGGRVLCLADLSAIKPFDGELHEVTFGDPARDHVTARLDNLTIELRRGARLLYWVDLERCLTPAQVLDWIFQLRAKLWMRPGLMSLFLEAVRHALDPQANLCSWGRPREIAKEELRRLVEDSLRDHLGIWVAYPEGTPLSWRPAR